MAVATIDRRRIVVARLAQANAIIGRHHCIAGPFIKHDPAGLLPLPASHSRVAGRDDSGIFHSLSISHELPEIAIEIHASVGLS
jgi:hypothetical protein